MGIGVIACGTKEFTAQVRSAAAGTGLEVVYEAASPEDLVSALDTLGAVGVLAPAEWAGAVADLAKARKNVHFFVCGRVKKNVWDMLAGAGVVVLSHDVDRAVEAMQMALERVSPVSFRYTDAQVSVVHNRVDVLTRTVAVFFSPKGGVGKTFTAVNAAAAAGMRARELTAETGRELRVALIDLSPNGGAKHYLGYAPLAPSGNPRSIAGFRYLHENSSFGAVSEAMSYHEPSNVYFAEFPGTAQERQAYNPGILSLCLSLVQKHFDFVFIDVGTGLYDQETVAALDAGTDIVLVCDADPATVGVLKDSLDGMGRVFGGVDRVRLVVNSRERENRGINPPTVARSLGLPLTAELPYCPAAAAAVKKGVPAVYLEPGGAFARGIALLVQKLLGTSAAAPGSGPGIPGLGQLRKLLKI